MARTQTYTVSVGKKPTSLDVLAAEPLSGVAPLHFTLHFTLNEAGGGINGKDCHLYVNGELVGTIKSHGIFGWYGAVGWVNGCVDFDVELPAGTHEVYAEFPGDSEYEGCRKLVRFTLG